MPNTTLPDSDQKAQDDKYAPKPDYDPKSIAERERHATEAAGDIPGGLPPGEQAALDQIEAGERERQGDITNNYTGKNNREKFNLRAFLRKRGAAGGIIGLLLGAGFVGGGFFAQGSLIIGVMENLNEANDSASTSMEQRFVKILQFMTNGSNPLCESNSMKCRMGKLSNSALYQMNKKGIAVVFNDDSSYDGKTKKGYPDKPIKVYRVDLNDGKGIRNITPENLRGFLVANPKFAAKVMGASGAFNMRVKAWTGEHIFSRLYKPFGLERKGGFANGKALPTEGRLQALYDEIKQRIPGLDKLTGAADSVKSKINGHLGKSKKGGVVYLGMVAGCIGVKAPGFIAAAVAAVQLGQILPIFMDLAASPGSSAKASAAGSGFSAADADKIGTAFTERTPRASDGKLTSMLDSQILLSSMGVGSGKPAVSQKFTPGLSILTNQLVLDARDAEQATEEACNAVMSPAAMYSAMAIDTATTLAASTTLVGGIIKVGASFVIAEVTAKVVEAVVGQVAIDALRAAATNNLIPEARGEELGDIMGIAATSFYSSGGMARHLPTLANSQVSAFNEIKQENETFHREMDIASLSPFDISSKYTFMGSIIHNMRNSAIINQGSMQNLGSGLFSILRSPMSLIFPTAAATNFDTACDYADDFALVTKDQDNGLDQTPAINIAGMPCTGLTREQVNMSTEEAIDLVSPWLDESKTVGDDDTIQDLVKSGYIRADTPLADYIADCGDASSGDYLFNSGSCVFDGSPTGSLDQIGGVKPANAAECAATSTGEDSEAAAEACATDWDNFQPAATSVAARQLAAMPVFLLDYQIQKSINGEDEVRSGGGQTASVVVDLGALYEDSTGIDCAAGTNDLGTETGYRNGNPVPIRLCELVDVNKTFDPDESQVVRVNSRVSGAFQALITKMRQDLGRVPIVSTFRTMAEQQAAYDRYGADRAAVPGTSNHQMGLAIDFQLDTGNDGATKPAGSDAVYDWLVANAGNFQVKKLGSESWHWEVTP